MSQYEKDLESLLHEDRMDALQYGMQYQNEAWVRAGDIWISNPYYNGPVTDRPDQLTKTRS